MTLPLESVPNFSEGRDQATIDALAGGAREHAELLDVHMTSDHNRSVFTLVGEEELVSTRSAGIAFARDRIDLRRHEGAHPRIGAADVVPLVPIAPGDMPRAQEAALALARRVGEESTYRSFSTGRWRRPRPAFFRSGGLAELERRIAAGEFPPDFGPRGSTRAQAGCSSEPGGHSSPSTSTSAADARGRAGDRRRHSRAGGGFPGVRALGLELPAPGSRR